MKDSRLSIILSVVAIVGVISVWLLWIMDSLHLAVISLDTFVGVIVALLAIIVTIVLGWQIINALELQGKIKDLEKSQSSILDIIRALNENVQNSIKLSSNLQSGIDGNNANAYLQQGQFVEAFVFFHSALSQAIKADQSGLENRIAQLFSICFQIFSPPMVDFEKLKKQIELDYQSIKETEAYRKYLSTSYEQVMKLFWDKMHSFGLK